MLLRSHHLLISDVLLAEDVLIYLLVCCVPLKFRQQRRERILYWLGFFVPGHWASKSATCEVEGADWPQCLVESDDCPWSSCLGYDICQVGRGWTAKHAEGQASRPSWPQELKPFLGWHERESKIR